MTVGQRRVWLALEEQKRRRARQSPLPPLVELVLSSDGHGRLTWTCNVPSPFGFCICHTDDDGNWNDYYDGADGNTTSMDESNYAGYIRVARVDENGYVMPPYSNVVYSDGK
jgi:hypothetical protein